MFFLGLQNGVFAPLNDMLFDGRLPMPDFEAHHIHRVVFQLLRPTVIGVGQNFCLANRFDVVDHLLHQMIHMRNVMEHGVKEWQSPMCHREFFMEPALARGLNLILHATKGWVISTSRVVTPCHAPTCDGDCKGKPTENCPVRVASEEAIRMRQDVYRSIPLTYESLLKMQELLPSQEKLSPV